MSSDKIDIRPIWSADDWPDILPVELQPYLKICRQIPLLIATRNNTVIGWAINQDKSHLIQDFYIQPDYCRQGIGSRLFHCLAHLLTDYGSVEIKFAPALINAEHGEAFLTSLNLPAAGRDISILHLNGLIPAALKDLQQKNKLISIPTHYGIQRALLFQQDATELTSIGLDCFQRPQQMFTQAAAAWTLMQHAANRDGIELIAVSAFRSIAYQHQLIQKKLQSKQTIEEILKVSAAPGFSEHHTGRAIDITDKKSKPLEEEFAQTKAYQWLYLNADDFGFHLSYPKDNPHAIAWEPWHWCWQAE